MRYATPAACVRRTGLPALVLAVVVLVVSGCAAKLVPAYDQAIVDGLTATNEQALTLFEAVSADHGQDSYEAHVEAYNAVIGKAEAGLTMIQARPMPTGKAAALIAGDTAPSEKSLGFLTEKLREMKKLHKNGELSSIEVRLAKEKFVASMRQAMVYERALEM